MEPARLLCVCSVECVVIVDVGVVLKFAQQEFRCSGASAERGRTLLEGIVAKHPRRGDVWAVYVNLEEQQLRKLQQSTPAAAAPVRPTAIVQQQIGSVLTTCRVVSPPL